jgi:hypothetical protein
MNTSSIRRFTITGFVALGLLLPNSATAWASHSWNGRQWTRIDGTTRAQVWFIDHTGSRWPVSSAVPRWNWAPTVDSLYRFGSCITPGTMHCVHVWEYNEAGGDYGYAQVSVNGNGHFTWAEIRLNSSGPSWGAADDRQTVCQELGHASGSITSTRRTRA